MFSGAWRCRRRFFSSTSRTGNGASGRKSVRPTPGPAGFSGSSSPPTAAPLPTPASLTCRSSTSSTGCGRRALRRESVPELVAALPEEEEDGDVGEEDQVPAGAAGAMVDLVELERD